MKKERNTNGMENEVGEDMNETSKESQLALNLVDDMSDHEETPADSVDVDHDVAIDCSSIDINAERNDDSDNSYVAIVDNHEEDEIEVVNPAIPPAPSDTEMAGPSAGDAPLFIIGQPRSIRRQRGKRGSEDSDDDVRIVPARQSNKTIDIELD